MEKVFFSKIGMGIIFESMEELEENVIPIEVEFKPGIIYPNTMTDLFGFWKCPILYKGILKDQIHNFMVFYLGNDNDLFDSRFYCDGIFWISETRMFKKYNDLSGRDFNLIDGKWK